MNISVYNHFFKIIFFIMFFSMALNLSKKMDRPDHFFDNWSEILVYSSLLYKTDFNKFAVLPRYLDVEATERYAELGLISRYEYFDLILSTGQHVSSPDNEYELYTSNLTIQATIFTQLLLTPLHKMGISLPHIIKIVKLLNIFLFSLVMTLFLFSLRTYFSHASLMTTAILIGIFSTHINLTAKSIYWSIWLYLVPYLVQYALLQTKRYKNLALNKKIFASFLVAFSTMTLFFSYHLETFSGAVIAMFLPYILAFYNNTLSKKLLIKQIVAIIGGSFIAMMGILIIKHLLVSYHIGWQDSLNTQQANLLLRLIPEENIFTTLKSIISARLTEVYFSLWGIINIHGKHIMILNILAYPISFGILMNYPTLKNRIINLLLIHGVLLLAAGSWYILAIPHSIVHLQDLQFLTTLFYIIPTGLVILEICRAFWFDRFLQTEQN